MEKLWSTNVLVRVTILLSLLMKARMADFFMTLEKCLNSLSEIIQKRLKTSNRHTPRTVRDNASWFNSMLILVLIVAVAQ